MANDSWRRVWSNHVFSACDADGDGVLGFYEFASVMRFSVGPCSQGSYAKEARRVFEDMGGLDCLSQDQFFR